nr:hypothetical protein [Microvirga sp. Mcv34]
MHERSLQVDREEDGQPDHVDIELTGDRGNEGQHDERDLEELKKEREKEYGDVQEYDEAGLSGWHVSKQRFDPDLSVQPAKDQCEERGAQKQEDDT